MPHNILSSDVGRCFCSSRDERSDPHSTEPISKSDGLKKNDCERNASGRLLRNFRREHPHLSVIVVEDGLSSMPLTFGS